MQDLIVPGSTIGVLGSGQLGRMLALAARQLGYRIHVFSPERDTPAGQVADLEICAAYDDLDAVRAFARAVDVVTYEFENVPADTAVACQQFAPLRPGPQALHIAQNRLREKSFFAENGLPTAPFTAVHSLADLQNGLAHIGCPAVLKTAVSGYDGKGQIKVTHPDEAAMAWQAAGQVACILEGWVEFEREVSVVAARGVDGRFAHYGLIENSHANHILDVSKAPANAPPHVTNQAVEMARCVLEALEVVGVLCVEFFLTGDGRLLLNEMAPRPHNSGHLTIEACVTSQFEQQCRAICGLPLGDTRYRQPAAMANLLGDIFQRRGAEGQGGEGAEGQRGEGAEGQGGEGAEGQRGEGAEEIMSLSYPSAPLLLRSSAPPLPRSSAPPLPRPSAEVPNWTAVLTIPNIKVHLYGKREARDGRKMGHLTALADSVEEAEKVVREARELLRD